MARDVTSLVAQELGLAEFSAEQPQASLFGVTNVEIESCDQRYRIYLVRDSNNDNVSLEESAKLAAFYNSQFILRAFSIGKHPGAFGKHEISFQIADDDDNHSIFVLKVPNGSTKRTLSFDDLCHVAESIAKLHSVDASFVSDELSQAISENHVNVKEYEAKMMHSLIDVLKSTVEGEAATYFEDPSSILEKVSLLMKHVEHETEEGKPVKTVPDVICHGRLTADSCRFSGKELVEVVDWENVHFSDHAEDLSHLIISAASPNDRQNHFLKVFRHYYYALVDIRAPKFSITYLRDQYRRHQKTAVLSGIENLLEVLTNSDDSETKQCVAHRWECALADAYAFETGDYISDDEQCYFSK